MLSETCFEIDFNLSDILSSIDDSDSVTSRKKTDSNGNLNSFSFSIDSIPSYELTLEVENDDDLDALLDSCRTRSPQPSGLISLAALANNHLSNNSSTTPGRKPGKCPSGSFLTSSKNDVSGEIKLLDCLEDILLDGKSEEEISCTDNLLSTLKWEHSSGEDSRKNERNCRSGLYKETADDELFPEINLSFCVKKNDKDTFSAVSSSPESSDSGFHEIDSSSENCISNSSGETRYWDSTFGTELVKSPSTHSKRSLLFRAISAQPKTDKARRIKLQNIRSELLKKCTPPSVFECKQKRKLQKFEHVIDQSDECVIESGFLKKEP